jgi:hypothetical protein
MVSYTPLLSVLSTEKGLPKEEALGDPASTTLYSLCVRVAFFIYAVLSRQALRSIYGFFNYPL